MAICFREVGVQTDVQLKTRIRPSDGASDGIFSNAAKIRKVAKKGLLTPVAEFRIRLPDDQMDCNITGILPMSADRLLLLDSNNSSLKLFNATRHMVAHMDIHTLPWDVTKISETEAAISLPNESSILFVSISPSLHRKRQISLKDGCYGLAYSNGRLYVGYRDRVSVLDLYGTQCSVIELPGLLSPRCLSKDIYILKASRDGSHVVACDRYSGRVTGVSLLGEQVVNFDGGLDFEPCGLDIDRQGRMFVCDAKSRRILLLSKDGSAVLQDLVTEEGFGEDFQPRTAAFYEDLKQIIVSGICSDFIRVYEVNNDGCDDSV